MSRRIKVRISNGILMLNNTSARVGGFKVLEVQGGRKHVIAQQMEVPGVGMASPASARVSVRAAR